MKKIEFKKFEKIILDFYKVDELRENVTAAGNVKTFIEDGAFDCYYIDAENTLKNVYGDEFDASVYENKDGGWKIKNGVPYVWTVYVNKMSLAIKKILK